VNLPEQPKIYLHLFVKFLCNALKSKLHYKHTNQKETMNSQTIINRATHAAAKHGSDALSRMSFHIGALEAEVQALCRTINEYTPVAEGVETTFKHAGCDLVVFYEAEDDGDIDITGVFSNGMDITELLMYSPIMDLVMEHVTDHAYIQRKQAAYDLAEQQWEARRDADMEGGAV
jgi:hypothetical protein